MLLSRTTLSGGAGRAHVAITDRHGGYSGGAFSSFNLARHVEDEATTVAANRSLLCSALGLSRISYVRQVHGIEVHEVTEAEAGSLTAQGAEPGTVRTADAQVTSVAGVGLAVLVADCTPVLLADPDAGVAGAVHAGRAGMAHGVVPAAVAAMRRLGASRIRAVIGPSVHPRNYEVPAELRAAVAAAEPVAASVSRTGTPALDVAAGVAEQLHREDVAIAQWSAECTFESEDLYSYRREASTGRFAGVVWCEARHARRG